MSRQFAKALMQHFPGITVQNQQARLVALGGGRLRDQLRRQCVIKIRGLHVDGIFSQPQTGFQC